MTQRESGTILLQNGKEGKMFETKTAFSQEEKKILLEWQRTGKWDDSKQK